MNKLIKKLKSHFTSNKNSSEPVLNITSMSEPTPSPPIFNNRGSEVYKIEIESISGTGENTEISTFKSGNTECCFRYKKGFKVEEDSYSVIYTCNNCSEKITIDQYESNVTYECQKCHYKGYPHSYIEHKFTWSENHFF